MTSTWLLQTQRRACEANLSQQTQNLEDEKALSAGFEADISTLTTDLATVTTAKSTCESAKTNVESDLATCQFDLTDAKATATTEPNVVNPKTQWLSATLISDGSFTLLQNGKDCSTSDTQIGIVNSVEECAVLCKETAGCVVFIVEHTSGTPQSVGRKPQQRPIATGRMAHGTRMGSFQETTYQVTPLTECTWGEFQSKSPTLTRDRECSSVTECASNQYEVTAPTAKSDRVCQDQPTCAPGQIVTVAGTATSPQVCENPCPAGQYKDVAADACVAVTACSDEEVETAAPTAISDRECGPKAACQFDTVEEYFTALTPMESVECCTAAGGQLGWPGVSGEDFYCNASKDPAKNEYLTPIASWCEGWNQSPAVVSWKFWPAFNCN